MNDEIIDVIDRVPDPLIAEHNLLVSSGTELKREPNYALLFGALVIGGFLIAGLRT